MKRNRSINTQTTKVGSQHGRSDRQGSILVAALVCLAIVTLILLSVFKTSMSQRRQIRLEQQHIQAELLAESGLERAVAKLKSNHDYVGEEWSIDAKQLDTRNSGAVKITVVKQDDRHVITAESVFPKQSESPKQTRSTRSVVFKMASDQTNGEPDTPNQPEADNKSDATDADAEVPQ